MERQTIDRAWTATLSAAVLITIHTTSVGIDTWILHGQLATTAAYLYALLYAALAARPHDRRLHTIALPATWVLWFGRATAAATTAAQGGPRNFWTVTAQAAAIAVLVTALHLTAIRTIAARQTVTR